MPIFWPAFLCASSFSYLLIYPKMKKESQNAISDISAIWTDLDAVSSLVRGTPNSSTWVTSFLLRLDGQIYQNADTMVCHLQIPAVSCVSLLFHYVHLLSSTYIYLLWVCGVVQNDKMMVEVEQLQRSHQADLSPWKCGTDNAVDMRVDSNWDNWGNSEIIDPGAEAA